MRGQAFVERPVKCLRRWLVFLHDIGDFSRQHGIAKATTKYFLSKYWVRLPWLRFACELLPLLQNAAYALVYFAPAEGTAAALATGLTLGGCICAGILLARFNFPQLGGGPPAARLHLLRQSKLSTVEEHAFLATSTVEATAAGESVDHAVARVAQGPPALSPSGSPEGAVQSSAAAKTGDLTDEPKGLRNLLHAGALAGAEDLGGGVAPRWDCEDCEQANEEADSQPDKGAPRWCDHCQRAQRPLESHCEGCSSCVMGRDHHCGAFGCCIADDNRHLFMVLMCVLVLCTGMPALQVARWCLTDAWQPAWNSLTEGRLLSGLAHVATASVSALVWGYGFLGWTAAAFVFLLQQLVYLGYAHKHLRPTPASWDWHLCVAFGMKDYHWGAQPAS